MVFRSASAKDSFGRLVVPAVLAAQVGGGFRIAAAEKGNLNQLRLPTGVKSLRVGSQLHIFDPLTLLNAFYNRTTNPTAYTAALGAASRVKISVEASPAEALARVFVLDAGSWLATSRLARSDDEQRSDAPLWSHSNFDLPWLSAGSFAANVFTGAPLATGSLLALKAQPATGPLLNLAAYLERTFAMPPTLTAIALMGAAPTPIAYGSASAENGLTRPFCHTAGDVGLTLAMPLDQDGATWSEATPARLQAEVSYHSTTAGKTTTLTPLAADFSGRYAASFATSELDGDGFFTAWDPATRLLTWTPPSAAAPPASTHRLSLPAALLPSTAGGATVTLVRVKLVATWPDTGAASGSVFWLKKSC